MYLGEQRLEVRRRPATSCDNGSTVANEGSTAVVHLPLTDVPIAAYLFGAVFDVMSLALHNSHERLAQEFFHMGTWVFLGGTLVSVLAARNGWADWHRSSEAGRRARRTVNTHNLIMIAVTVLTLADLALRLFPWEQRGFFTGRAGRNFHPNRGDMMVGATYRGTLLFDSGFNVETAVDSPVGHRSEFDSLPGQQPLAPAPDSGGGA